MYIDEQQCTGCGNCIPYCPVGAITDQGGVSFISLDDCVECGVCFRYADCPAGAIYESPESRLWPRSIRGQLSDPTSLYPGMKVRGRGTEEMKTNDVTNRVRRGEVGIGLEFGRPGIGTRLSEVEKMTRALAPLGVQFEPENPVTSLLEHMDTGTMSSEVLSERVLSAIVEITTTREKLPQLLMVMHEVAAQVDTVITWELIGRFEDNGDIPLLRDLEDLGYRPRPNAKVNLGMGRPSEEAV